MSFKSINLYFSHSHKTKMYLSYNIILMLLKLSYLFDLFKFKYINAIKLRTTVWLKIEDKEMNILKNKKPMKFWTLLN